MTVQQVECIQEILGDKLLDLSLNEPSRGMFLSHFLACGWQL